MSGVDIRERRWQRLQQYLREECADDKTRLADRLDRSLSQTSRLLNKGKNHVWIGEKLARKLEVQMSKPAGWLDLSESSESDVGTTPVVRPIFRWPFKIEYQRFEALDKHQQTTIAKTIVSLIEAFEVGQVGSKPVAEKQRARRR